MNKLEKHDLLDGVTLEQIVTALVDDYGWEKLAKYIRIKCFATDPSIKSSLKFLRKTDWARTKVEDLYVAMKRREQRSRDKR
jgi:uncharacterized protein (DUF2132 family)